jgi:hypothetical protein
MWEPRPLTTLWASMACLQGYVYLFFFTFYEIVCGQNKGVYTYIVLSILGEDTVRFKENVVAMFMYILVPSGQLLCAHAMLTT